MIKAGIAIHKIYKKNTNIIWLSANDTVLRCCGMCTLSEAAEVADAMIEADFCSCKNSGLLAS